MDGRADRPSNPGRKWLRAFSRSRQRGGDEGQHHHGGERKVDPAVLVRAGEDRVGEQTCATTELDHRGQEPARPAEVLGGDDVGDDACEGRTGGIEEELHPGVAEDDLRVGGRCRQHQQAG